MNSRKVSLQKLALLIAFAAAAPSLPAQESCESLFKPKPLYFFPEAQTPSITPAPDLSAKIERLKAALYFIDFRHSAQTFADFIMETRTIAPASRPGKLRSFFAPLAELFGFPQLQKSEVDLARFYDVEADRPGLILPAFANYQAGAKFLASDPRPWSFAKLSELHKICMKDGIEATPFNELGQIRDPSFGGDPNFGGTKITPEQIVEVESNPYLNYDRQGVLAHTHVLGTIKYPDTSNAKPVILERLQTEHADLVRRVRVFQEQLKSNPALTDLALHRELIEALVNDSFAWFNREKGRIGSVNSREKVAQFTLLAARLHRNLISIHPFTNGNGRSIRLVIGKFFEDAGLPNPRLWDVDADIYASIPEYAKQLMLGMENTRKFNEDMQWRALMDLPLEQSPELFLPTFVRKVRVDEKFQSGRAPIPEAREIPVDPGQFRAFLKHYLPNIEEAYAYLGVQHAVNTLKVISGYFADWVKKNRVYFHHDKEGEGPVGISFIDADFLSTFNRSYRKNPVQWLSKMKRWYQNRLIWRGLSYPDRVVPREEILGMFTQLHPQMTSNTVYGHHVLNFDQRTAEAAVRADFERYNQDAYFGQVISMVKDHTEVGPKYEISYGYSTSKREEVSKAYAMGAMVVADYGKHQEFQHLLKSRILVGAYQSHKDVDAGRLHQLDPSFAYKYGRQAEVMGVGAADPDSIMIVKEIGPKGETIHTFARDPRHPDQVWIIEGDFDGNFSTPPPPSRLKEIITLDNTPS